MRKHQINIILLISFLSYQLSAQSISEVIEKYTTGSVEWIHATEIQPEKFLFLDAREKEEFSVSKIQNAKYVGYSQFEIAEISKQFPNKNQPIIVYCSLGVRSEHVALQLKEAGYSKVYNLYGGIFEWKNKGFEVFDSANRPTENVHAFSKKWSVYLTKGKRVYE